MIAATSKRPNVIADVFLGDAIAAGADAAEVVGLGEALNVDPQVDRKSVV